MNPIFQCPKCKEIINSNNNYYCINCTKNYTGIENVFYDFINNDKEPQDNKISSLLSEIHKSGYLNGVSKFLKNYPYFNYKFEMKEGDIVFHCANQHNKRCLVIDSDLGNLPNSLSHIFDEVYSLDVNEEKILIQKFRFKENKINNIVLIKSNVMSLPFCNNYFDLVIFNGIHILKQTDNVKKCFKEIKRILTESGCFCIGTENKFGLKIFEDSKINEISRKKSFIENYNTYKEILKDLDFKIKPYWVLPSYKKPYFSGKIDDEASFEWILNNLGRFFSKNNIKLKIIPAIWRIFSKKIQRRFVKLFSPYFIFYCYKGKYPETLDEIIIKKTKFKNFIFNGRRIKFIYILFDELGIPKKILSCKREKYNLTEKIVPTNRIYPNMTDPKDKIIIEDWFDGDVLDPLCKKEVSLAMKWLISFQSNASLDLYSEKEIEKDIENLKNNLSKRDEIKDLPYNQWLDEYKKYIKNIELKKAPIHGDFWYRNIIFDKNKSKINVIDWEMFQKEGNPHIDFMMFILFIMIMSKNPIKEFHSNLNRSGKAFPIIKIIKDIMDEYFQTNLNLSILLRFIILNLIPRSKKNGKRIQIFIELLYILSKNPNFFLDEVINCQKLE